MQGDSAKVGSPKARCLWRQECLEWFRGLPTLAYFDTSVRDCHLQPLTEFDGNEHHRRLLQDSRADPSVITMIIPASDAIHTSSSKLRIRPCKISGQFKVFAAGVRTLQIFIESRKTKAATVPTRGGRYKLDLSRPYHRAMLRMLCKTAERYKVLPVVFWGTSRRSS